MYTHPQKESIVGRKSLPADPPNAKGISMHAATNTTNANKTAITILPNLLRMIRHFLMGCVYKVLMVWFSISTPNPITK